MDNSKINLPLPVLAGTFIILLGLTAAAVFLGRIDFENYNHYLLPLPAYLHNVNDILVAVIVCLQVLLIAAVFMGLIRERPLFSLLFSAGVFVAVVIVVLTLSDTLVRGTADDIESARLPTAEMR
jgi:hypothetical protein